MGWCGARVGRDEGLVDARTDTPWLGGHPDPVEKKPLFHFLPGSIAWSLARPGCNMKCRYCQNHHWSHPAHPLTGALPQDPGELIRLARHSGASALAFTYTEPTVWWEHCLPLMHLAREEGLRTIWVTNGWMEPQTLKTVLPFLDAVNLDLKGGTEAFYETWCRASLAPVCKTLHALVDAGVWTEVSTPVLPHLHLAEPSVEALVNVMKPFREVVPWHLNRVHPAFHYNGSPTPVSELASLAAMVRAKGHRFVYTGNLPLGVAEQDTLCPGCGRTIIFRITGQTPRLTLTDEGRCPSCQTPIPGVWS